MQDARHFEWLYTLSGLGDNRRKTCVVSKVTLAIWRPMRQPIRSDTNFMRVEYPVRVGANRQTMDYFLTTLTWCGCQDYTIA